jgi:hypothetical protein
MQLVTLMQDDRSAMHFTLHDTIYDLAVTASSGKLINLNSTYSYQSFSEKNSYRYACLANFDVSALNLSGISSAQLSVLLFHGCRTNKQLSDDLFSPAKYLRVLDLRDFCLQKLPNSICQLRQLRYLNLSGCSSLVNLPDSFGNLLNLGHIDLSGCSRLLELPASFGNLRNVVHIDLSGCIGLKALPPESFGLLKRLEHFDLSSCSCLEGIPYFVNGLTNLQYLNLSHPCCYLAKHRFHLNALKDIWVKLINLRYLNLSMCLNPMFCYLPEKERIEYIESISCLHKLEHLDLSHNIFLSDVPESLGQLGELQTLNLSGCVRLKRIDKWMGERNCPKKFLVVSNCLGLERYQFAVRTDGGGKRSNLAQLKDVSCKEVEISCLEKVISTEEAQSIGLTEKKKLQKLTLVWSAGRDDVSFRDQDLLAELVPPKNLQCFELHGYSSAYLPAWLASNMLSHLPNLMEVTMVDIPNCSNLPPFGVLPNLQRLVLKRVTKVIRIDADHLGGDSKAAFRRPLHVTLDGMLNLEEIDTYSCHDRFEFPTLDELVINKCPKLRFGDNPPPKARMLVISDCDQLMVSPVEKRGEHVEDPSSSTCTTSAPVTEVVIESCKMPLSELKWSLLEGLAPLHSLHIRNCSEKIISPEIMKDCLSSLQLLCFSHCVNMTYLPEHVVQDTSLKELVIDECRGIKSLPQSVYEERNKHYPLLRIRDCPELKKWCELEENKTKLAHIEIIFE